MHTTKVWTSPLVETLIEVLAQEQGAFDKLLGLLGQEQKAVRTLSSQAMADANLQKLALLEEIGPLEQKRTEVVAELAAEWAVSREELTLRAIAERVGDQDGGALLRKLDQLNKTIAGVRDASEFNGSLIAGALDCFRQLLAACCIPERQTLYSATGSLQPALTSGQAFVGRRG
ncbi:MAG: flagellar protein FlgN [Nitrospirae bacterium]|nr:flagellar protein FlgN [Nitrospirota bacterium]